MRNIRLYLKRISLWIILVLQVLLISSYFLLQSENSITTTHNKRSSVAFIKPSDNAPISNEITYQTRHNRIVLKVIPTSDLYMDFNSSLCYKSGTDLKAMHRSKNLIWKCDCIPGWHGNDCGQPEVIWRAILAYRKPLHLQGPRKFQRRIVYLIQVNEIDLTMTEIRIRELGSIVSLFVLYENETSNYFETKLQNKFLKDYHDKILYLKISDLKKLWQNVKSIISNLEEDDIILVGGPNDVPNSLALQFLKLYNKWPQPIRFRYRWSVYGFFWVHPSKTILKSGASSVLYLYETLADNIESLYDNKTINFSNKGLIVGDLNHFGGWFCEFCYDSLKIIDFLKITPSNIIKFNNYDKQKIDNSYIEDLIENGIYLDGKTELIRTHRFQERYYAPIHVTNNSWKYDWLLTNLYSKMDYY